MRNKFFLAVVLFFVSQIASSQHRISYGPEIGINSSGISYSHQSDLGSNTFLSNKTEYSLNPLLSPVVGFWISRDLNKRFFANASIHYYWVGGTNRNSNIQQWGGFHPSSWREDKWINQEFHKFSLPVVFGYNFYIKGIKAFTFLGYSQSYYVFGTIHEKYQSTFNSLSMTLEEPTANPFDKNQFSITPARYRPSIVFGIGAHLTNRISFVMNVTVNWKIYYSKTILPYVGYFESSHTYQNEDYSLLLKYSLN